MAIPEAYIARAAEKSPKRTNRTSSVDKEPVNIQLSSSSVNNGPLPSASHGRLSINIQHAHWSDHELEDHFLPEILNWALLLRNYEYISDDLFMVDADRRYMNDMCL